VIAAGKRTQIQPAPGTAADSGLSTAVPGKRTLTEDVEMPPASVTGDGIADLVQAGGAPTSGPNAFLEPAQRLQIAQDGASRWLATEDRCHAAILQVAIKEAIRPEDPMPLWVTMLVEAASVGVMVGASRAIETAQERGGELLKDAAVWTSLGAVASRREHALMMLAQASPQALDAMVELGVSASTKTVERTADGSHAAIGSSMKDALLDSVLVGFHDRMSVVFERLREHSPLAAIQAGDDAQLLAWFHLGSAAGPLSMAFWMQVIAEKVARFRASGVQELGISSLGNLMHREKRLQWRNQGGKRSLAMVEVAVTDGCDPDYDDAEFVRWVPEEFVESALALSEGMEIVPDHPSASECEPDFGGSSLAGAVPL
jgi:hypothetical protein